MTTQKKRKKIDVEVTVEVPSRDDQEAALVSALERAGRDIKGPQAPRDDLFRMHSQPEEWRIEHRDGDGSDSDGDGDGNTLVGHLAVFDSPTVIDSWEGRFEETIAPGAFKKTVRENGDSFKVQFDHGFGDYAQPIAVPTVLEEDDRGLYLEARFIDTDASQTVKELVRSGAVDGMSFRFSVIKDEWDELDSDLPKRTLLEVRAREGGPVTFPAYEATTAGVRGRDAYEQWRQGRVTAPGGERGKLDDTEPPAGTPSENDDEPPSGTRHAVEPLISSIQQFLDERSNNEPGGNAG